MRRVLLFAAFLLLLGLTTATAASFDVQAEDITSFSEAVTIVTPPPPLPPAPAEAGREYFMINDPAVAKLVGTDPMTTSGNEKASFDLQAIDITTEQREAGSGQKYAYVAWLSGALTDGIAFSDQRVRVYIDRTAGQTVELTAGLFACDPLAARATVITDRCILLVQGDGTGNTITLGPFTGDVPRNRELRLKIVNLTNDKTAIQWGYSDNNRDGRIRILTDAET